MTWILLYLSKDVDPLFNNGLWADFRYTRRLHTDLCNMMCPIMRSPQYRLRIYIRGQVFNIKNAWTTDQAI